MATITDFNGQEIVEPGAYSEINGASGVNSSAVDTFGVVMLIDTGIGTGFVGGASINGQYKSGINAVQDFYSPDEMKAAVKGGIIWDLVDYLWSPSNTGRQPQKVSLVKAATTVAATLAMTVQTSPAASLTLAARNEGTFGNGVVTSGILTNGYGLKWKSGVLDPAKFIIEFYEGQFKGLKPNGSAYEFTQAELVTLGVNNLIASTPEFSSFFELVNILSTDSKINQYFRFVSSTGADFNFTSGILTLLSGVKVFTGGTTVYSSTDVDDVLEAIADVDNDMFLCLDYAFPVGVSDPDIATGTNKGARATANQKILAYVNNNSTYTEKALYIGGGDTDAQFDSSSDGLASLQTAAFYNSPLVNLIHGGTIQMSLDANNDNLFSELPSIYAAAMVCGIAAGLQPQVPLTWKSVRISGVSNPLSKSQRVRAIKGGVIHFKQVSNSWVINQGINTMQINTQMVNVAGNSPEISVMRIKHQLNKELVINAAPFTGANQFTASDAEVVAFTQTFLQDRTVEPGLSDNLILGYKNVTAQQINGKKVVRYCFKVNEPNNQTFFIGTMFDSRVTF